MIRAHSKVVIPAHLIGTARSYRHCPFEHIELDQLVDSLTDHIPFPPFRQRHSLVVLGGGWCESHTDDIPHALSTCYVVPIRFPKGAELVQEKQVRLLERGRVYSLNQHVHHEVRTPEDSRGYSAFLIADILAVAYATQQQAQIAAATHYTDEVSNAEFFA